MGEGREERSTLSEGFDFTLLSALYKGYEVSNWLEYEGISIWSVITPPRSPWEVFKLSTCNKSWEYSREHFCFNHK